MRSLMARLTPVSPRTNSARSSPENGPLSLWLTGIRPRLPRFRWEIRRFCRRGRPERRSLSALLALRGLSAGDKHRGRQHLRQLFRRLFRSVPQIITHPRPAATLEESCDPRVSVGPVRNEYGDPGLLECSAHLVAVN